LFFPSTAKHVFTLTRLCTVAVGSCVVISFNLFWQFEFGVCQSCFHQKKGHPTSVDFLSLFHCFLSGKQVPANSSPSFSEVENYKALLKQKHGGFESYRTLLHLPLNITLVNRGIRFLEGEIRGKNK